MGGLADFGSFFSNMYAGNEEKGLGNDLNGIANQFNPFVNYGSAAGKALSDWVRKMLTDPSGQYNDIMKNFSMTPDQQDILKRSLDDTQQTMSNAAAITGGAGSTSTARNLQDRLLSTDAGIRKNLSQQYYHNIMDELGRGASGAANLEQMGLGALGQQSQLQAQGDTENRQGNIHKAAGIDNLLASVDSNLNPMGSMMGGSGGGGSNMLSGLMSMFGGSGGSTSGAQAGASGTGSSASSGSGGMSMGNLASIAGLIMAFM